jgi:hypothetical protein
LLSGLVAPLVLAACAEAGSGAEAVRIGGRGYDADAFVQWKLPGDLREVSGLALDAAGHLLAHEDERARVWRIALDGPQVIATYDLGAPALRGDFEGIAWHDGRLYLVTSAGELLVAEPGDGGAGLAYRRFDTGAGRWCEVEGLEYEPATEALLLACKTARSEAARGYLTVLRWSTATARLLEAEAIRLPLSEVLPRLGIDDLNPSGIALVPGSGTLLLVAARQRVLVEITPAGELVTAVPLPRREAHRQAEGVVVTRAGDLVVADEGGDKRGRLSVYRAVP